MRFIEEDSRIYKMIHINRNDKEKQQEYLKKSIEIHKKICEYMREIIEILGIKQPSVSRHLKKLKMAGIIMEKKNGFFTEYFPVKNGIWFELWKKIKQQLQREKVIKEDEKKLKKVDRCKIKCK